VKRPFSTWKEGAIIYVPWLVMGAACTWVTWPGGPAALGILFLASGAFAVYFFRDPPRTVNAGTEVCVKVRGKVRAGATVVARCK
jgi:hypothetical protein